MADTIDTFVYRKSFMLGTNFGYTTAVGLLKSVIGVGMIWGANKITTKMGEDGCSERRPQRSMIKEEKAFGL